MREPESWKSLEGQVVDGKFPLRQLLGTTEHSAVFLTEMPGANGKKCAIKLIETPEADVKGRLAQLQAAAKLSHPNLIRLFESGPCVMDGASFVYVVMEYAEENLAQILPQRPLSAAEVSDLLPPLLNALSFLHSKGFVHTRVKPSNVLAVGNQLTLSSDQISAVGEPNENRRRRDVFDAPETAAGIVSPVGDVWSVGVTLVAAITQNVNLAEETSIGGRSLPETIPEPYRGIVRECLRLDPQRRSSLAEIQAKLQPPGRSVPQVREPLPVPPRSINRRPGFAIALVLVIAVLVIFGIIHSRAKNTSAKNSEATPQPAAQTVLPTSPASEPADTPRRETVSAGEVTHRVLPEIPKSAKNTIRGTIKITARVEVDSSGKVTEAKLKSPGPSRYFADKALKAAREWEFSPPQADGQPTNSAWLVQFRLRRSSIDASAQRVTR